MSNMVAWLTEILDTDERGWQHRIKLEGTGKAESLQMFGLRFPELMLADIAAKRAIVQLHRETDWFSPSKLGCEICHDDPSWGPDVIEGPCATLRLLASAYADRPGYDAAWKPSE